MNILERINQSLRRLGETPAASASMNAALRRKINAKLAAGITSGYPYAQSFGAGLTAAYNVLAEFGIEPARAVSPPLGNKGRVNIDIAFTNKEDSFSPVEISNSLLVVTFENMHKGVEIIAYVS